MNSDEPLVSITEAAHLAGVTPSTIRRWEIQGKLPTARRTLGGHRRYLASEVREALARAA
jgi:excisionase family DNA binding protein